ncbi:response regulator [soil metagenome]
MPDLRPRLLIVTDTDAPASQPGGPPFAVAGSFENLGHALGATYELRIVLRDEADELLRTGAYAGVLASPAEYLGSAAPSAGLTWVSVLNALGEGVCIASPEGELLWANAEFTSYSPRTQERIAAACRAAARAGAELPPGADAESLLRRKLDVPGEPDTKIYEVVVSPVASARTRAAPQRWIAVVRDVSAVRRTQQKMAAIDRAGSELVRIDADVVRKLVTTQRLRVLEQKIVKYAHDLLNFDHFAIRLLSEKSGKLELVMSHGLPPEAMEVELFARRDGNGISGYVAAMGRSYIAADTRTDARYVTGASHARSSLTVPLRLNDKIIGVFNVESTRVAAFDEEDREFLEMFSNHVALALHILDLLVVERCMTGQAVTGTFEGELNEPLEDIKSIAARLKDAMAKGALDASTLKQVERILQDVDAIKRRVKDAAAGPGAILGSEKALSDAALDPAIAGRRVLLADDDPRIRQTVRQLLTALGAEVVACENGGEALTALSGIGGVTGPVASSAQPGQERSTDPEPDSTRVPGRFDLVISDIQMPDKTGYQIFEAARKVQPDLPVILMTGFGYDPHHSIVRASEEGLQCVLFKPFQAESLIQEVHKAMAKPRPMA